MSNRSGLISFVALVCTFCAACNDSQHDATARTGGVEPPAPRTGRSTLSVSDARGDLVSASKEDDWFEEATPAPRQQHGDILGMRVQQTATEVLVDVHLADLRPRARAGSPPLLRLNTMVKTDAGISRDVELWVGPHGASIPTISMLSNSEPVDCPLAHSTNVTRGIVTERIPRQCLGDPRWVRVGVSCLTWQADGETMTLDLALVRGYDAAREDDLSPPVHEA